MRRIVPMVLLMALAPLPASAVITFTQLDDDVFTVSHRIKGFGMRGKAMRLVYTKTASLCVAAGYTHYSVLEQESRSSQPDRAANATVRVQFHLSDGNGRISCDESADPEYVKDARAKLAKRGYVPPDAAADDSEAERERESDGDDEEATSSESCSAEQIAAMARAGLSDEQIQAACDESRQESEG